MNGPAARRASDRRFHRALALNLAGGVALGAAVLAFTTRGLGWEPAGALPVLGGVRWTDDARTLAAQRADAVHAMLLALRALALLGVAVAATNLLFRSLDHALARRAELQLRAALGAAPVVLVRWTVRAARTALLGGLGVGVAGALLGYAVLVRSWPRGLGAWGAAPDYPAGVGVIGALGLLVLLGLALPALGGASGGLSGAFGVGAGVTAGPLQLLLRRAFTRGQFMASMGLALAAGLLLRGTIGSAAAGPAGASQLWTVPAAAPPAESLKALHGRGALGSPGAWSGEGPLETITSFCRPECAEGGMLLPVLRRPARIAVVSPGYLPLVGAALGQGRDFTAADGPAAESVAVVTRRASHRLFPARGALGQHLTVGDETGARVFRVVGVVDDPPLAGGSPGPTPLVYLSALQVPARSLEATVRARSAGDAAAYLAAVGPASRAPRSLADQSRALSAPARWSGAVLAFLAVAALGFCGYGLHGLAAAGMAARTAEIGVRMALGATPARIRRLALGEALRVAAMGTLLGLMLSLPIAGALRTSFPRIPLFEPDLAVGAGLLLAGLAVAACWRPARRAAEVEPREALSG